MPRSSRRSIRSTALVLLLLSFAAPAAAQLGVGEVAPGFTLSDVGGTPRSLADYDGQVVVLFFVGYG